MLLFDDQTNPVIIDSIHTPTTCDHMWVLDLTMLDYTLAPLNVFEEIICDSLQVCINGFEFVVPAMWNILVFDRDTSQLDVIEIRRAIGREFTALVYGTNMMTVQPATISVTNLLPDFKNVAPALNKHQMLCHPIGPNEWVNIAPSDGYNKYLKDCIVGDII